MNDPHIKALTSYVRALRGRYPPLEFPDFDPLDGGQNADILFLMEKPGPKTSIKGGGSGFISRDNDDPTAEAIFRFMNDAGISRERTVLWNTIPGWNETIKLTPSESSNGMAELSNLLELLPNLKTIVLVGRRAERATKILSPYNLRLIISAHPSPKVRSINRPKWDLIPTQWSLALDTIAD